MTLTIYLSILLFTVYLGFMINLLNLKKKVANLIVINKNILSHNNEVVSSFQNYRQNKYYELALVYIQLKTYQQELIDNLNLMMELEVIELLEKNIIEIDNILKEMGMLTPNVIKKITKNFSVIEFQCLDKNSNFFKN